MPNADSSKQGAIDERTKPVVAVTANRSVCDGVHRDWIRNRYVESLQQIADCEAVILSTVVTSAWPNLSILTCVDGLLLTGDESNLDPSIFQESSRYGQHYIQNQTDQFRDVLSREAIRKAVALELPLLAICRGLQELNVFFGGGIHQNLVGDANYGDHREDLTLPRDRQYDPVHEVNCTKDGVLRKIIGLDRFSVNSLHNQAVEKLAAPLVAEAYSDDGLIEAASLSGARTFQMGVQWHPEWHATSDRHSAAIFQAFGESCWAHFKTKSHSSH